MSRRRHLRLVGVVWCCVILAASHSAVVLADVFNMPSGQKSLQFVNVGDPGNAGDTVKMAQNNLIINGNWDTSSGYGAVPYSYAMSEYDVTTAQYCQFLNAVASKSDPYGLYNPLMGGATSGPGSSDPNDPIGTTAAWVTISGSGKNWPVVCGITRTGTAGHYSYALSTSAAANLGSPPIPANNGNFPVNWDSWGDAARFANWLQNGQPTGGEGPGTTETGAYNLITSSGTGATTVADLFAVTRSPGAKYWIPTENEWYKAAYYKGGGTNSGYWYYPTQSTTSNPPSSVLSTTLTNNANFNSSGLATPNNWPLTPVGYYASSPSHYGTFDQGGDLYNFTETAVTQTSDNIGEGLKVRVLRGGSFHHNIPDELAANWRYGADPAKFGHGRTFRVATVFIPVWTGAATGANNWSTLGNWSGDAPPVAGVFVQFGPLANGGHAANHNDLAPGTQLTGITFTSGAPNYSLDGNSITLGGPVTNQSASPQTIGFAMQLVAGGGTMDTGASTMTLAEPISGTDMSLTKIGSGTLVLAANNTYSGGTTISSGTLDLLGQGAILDGTSLTVGADAAIFNASSAAAPITDSAVIAVVPEPSTLRLLIAAVCGVALCQSIRSRRK
jgi:formylglycine-generating enzyme